MPQKSSAAEGMAMLMLIVVAKALVEIALLGLLGRGLLALLAGQNREKNLFYQLFVAVTAPVIKMARLVSPKVILDRHLPLVALLLLFFAWVGLTIGKIYYVKFVAGI